MKAHLIIGGLLLVLLSLALAQDNPKKIEPIRPVTPIPEEGKKAVKSELRSPVEVTPTPESQPTPERLNLRKITPVSGSQETFPEYAPWGLKQAPQISVLQEPLLQYTPMALKGVDPVQPVDGMNYQVQEFNDFRGGLNLSSYKTKLAPNEALELENALWNPGGEMYMRSGYDTLKTTPEVFNFLYRYYQQDGDKYLMGGSDTALYFWEEDSSAWTYLIGTEGTSGRWDGTTFDDLFVGTHEGIEPIVWDGVGFIEIGTIPDSFKITNDTYLWTTSPCWNCSTRIEFESAQTGWDAHEWADYILSFPIRQKHYNGNGDWDTLMKQEFILDNDAYSVYIKQFSPPMGEILYQHAKILSWFEIDTVWREGTIDSAAQAHPTDALPCHSQLWDEDFYWDSTFNYNDYIFEVTSGTGEGYRRFLVNWTEHAQIEFVPWDTSAFFMYGIGRDCFDSTTHYRIYKLTFWTGAKFCENFDSRLWFGWTGVGEEQEKNRLIYSAPSGEGGLGNWPPENYILIESKDGDVITGMKVFEPEGTYRPTPYAELLVGKNQSLYRIFPYIIAGELDYKTIRISSGVGVCSNAGMANVEGRFMIFPDQHGVYVYDGKISDKPISAKIDPIFEEWDLANLEDVSAVYNPQDRHYYISLPIDIDTVINGEFTTTFYRDSSGTDNQFVHLITTLGGEQDGDIEITDDTSSSYCDIASDTLGNYCVLIKDVLNLFLYRYDSLDQRVGATIKVNDADNKVTPAESHVDMNNNGQIVVVWEDFRDDTYPNGTYDIYGQCFRFDDGKVGNNFPVNSNWETNVNGAKQASVAINDDSICIFAWQDWDDPTGFQTCIFVAIDTFPIAFTPLGDTVVNGYFKPIGGWRLEINPDPPPDSVCSLGQSGPQGICSNSWWYPDVDAGDSAFVMVCTDDPMESYGRYIVMNYSLATLSKGILGQVEMNGSDHHSVSMNKKGRFVATWAHLKGLGDYDIWAVVYDIGEATTGSYFRVDNTSTGISATFPAVALNEEDQYCIVWKDERCGGADYYRCYTWSGGAVSDEALLNDICDMSGAYYHPEITATNDWLEIDTTKYTLAWNIDHHGWSKESFNASAYCYQHSLTDPVKILFADPEDSFVYNYATQADDIDESVILTYQTGYFGFSQWPSFNYQMRFATLEAYLDTGTVYLDWYKDYSDLTYQDSIMCGTDCRQEMALPDTLRGKNFSMKLTTGSETDNFTLSKFYWEYIVEPNRR